MTSQINSSKSKTANQFANQTKTTPLSRTKQRWWLSVKLLIYLFRQKLPLLLSVHSFTRSLIHSFSRPSASCSLVGRFGLYLSTCLPACLLAWLVGTANFTASSCTTGALPLHYRCTTKSERPPWSTLLFALLRCFFSACAVLARCLFGAGLFNSGHRAVGHPSAALSTSNMLWLLLLSGRSLTVPTSSRHSRIHARSRQPQPHIEGATPHAAP